MVVGSAKKRAVIFGGISGLVVVALWHESGYTVYSVRGERKWERWHDMK